MALTTQGEIIKEFMVRANQSTLVAFYTDAILTSWASNAHQWAASRYKWPMTEGRIETTTASLVTSGDGYTTLTYPEGFRPDSIRMLTIGGKRFKKTNFYKFQSYLQDNSAASDNIFTDFMRVVYINPNANDLSGTVVAWGQFNVAPLATDTSGTGVITQDPTATTIFTGTEEDGNEAIVEKMREYGFLREKDTKNADYHRDRAEKMLDAIWKRIGDEQAMYQTTKDDGIFERFDVVNGGFRRDDFRRDQFNLG